MNKEDLKRIAFEILSRIEEDNFRFKDEVVFWAYDKPNVRTSYNIKITKTEKEIDFDSFEIFPGYIKWKDSDND